MLLRGSEGVEGGRSGEGLERLLRKQGVKGILSRLSRSPEDRILDEVLVTEICHLHTTGSNKHTSMINLTSETMLP